MTKRIADYFMTKRIADYLRRGLALLLCLCMVAGYVPVPALADGAADPHHPVHTPECGYAEADPGAPCTHVHDDSCYILSTACVHTHDASCYSDASLAEQGTADACTHTCSEASGCVTRVLACAHVHDAACGYREAQPGSPCTFVCTEEHGAAAEEPTEPETPEEEPTGEPTEPEEALQTILSWSWVDDLGAIDPETGKLMLTGDANAPAALSEVLSVLPGAVLARIGEGEQTVPVSNWRCDDYPASGACAGSYVFAAELPQGYALAESAPALRLTVAFEAAVTLEETGSVRLDYTDNTSAFFDTFDEALTASMDASPSTIVLLDSVTSSGKVAAYTSNVTLNLNGYDLMGTLLIQDGATFRLINTGEDGSVTECRLSGGSLKVDNAAIDELEVTGGSFTLTGADGSALLITMKGGSMTVESGKIGRLTVKGGSVTVESGMIGRLTVENGNVQFSGGEIFASVAFDSVASGRTLLDLLAPGYAFADFEDGTLVDGNADSLDRHVKVVPHTEHSYADGTCACGVSCEHPEVKDGECTDCGRRFAAAAIVDGEVTVCDTIGEAIQKILAARSLSYTSLSLKLLADCEYDYGFNFNGASVTIDLNGYTLRSRMSVSAGEGDTTSIQFISSRGTGTLDADGAIGISVGTYGGVANLSVGSDVVIRGGTISATSYPALNISAGNIVLWPGAILQGGIQNSTDSTLASFLASACLLARYDSATGTVGEALPLDTKTWTQSDLIVLSHPQHSFADGVCTVCGAQCDHGVISMEDGTCAFCGIKFAAVTMIDGQLTPHISVKEALYPMTTAGADGMSDIRLILLADCTTPLSFTPIGDTTRSKITIDLNGHVLDCTFTLYSVDFGRNVYITSSGSTGKLYSSENTLDVSSSARAVTRLVVEKNVIVSGDKAAIRFASGDVMLNQGTILLGGIANSSDEALSSFVPANCLLARYDAATGTAGEPLPFGTKTWTQGDLIVVPHTEHTFDKETHRCIYCDASCNHGLNTTEKDCINSETGVCERCGEQVYGLLVYCNGRVYGAVEKLSDVITLAGENPGSLYAARFLKNMTSTGTPIMSAGTLSLDLNGYTLSFEENDALSVNGGTLNLTSSAESAGKLSFTGLNGLLVSPRGSVTIENCDIAGGNGVALNVAIASKVRIAGGTFTGGIAAIEGSLADMLAEGFAFALNGQIIDAHSKGRTSDTLTVVPHTEHTYVSGVCACGATPAASVVEEDSVTTYYDHFVDALTFAQERSGSTVTLFRDETVDGRLRVESGAFTIDWNGHTLSGNASFGEGIPGLLTVSGNGTSLTLKDGVGGGGITNSSGYALSMTMGFCTVNIESGVYSGGFYFKSAATNYGKLCLSGGTFHPYSDSIGAVNAGLNSFAGFMAKGYALALDASGTELINMYAANTVTPGGKTVYVVAHTHKLDADDNCACGLHCDHETLDENGWCSVCGGDFAAEVLRDGERKVYSSFLDALNAVNAASGDAEVILRLTQSSTLTSAIHFGRSAVLDLNGYELLTKREGGTPMSELYVKTGATLTMRSSREGGRCDITLWTSGTEMGNGILESGSWGNLRFSGRVDVSGGSAAYLQMKNGTVTGGRLDRMVLYGQDVQLSGGSFGRIDTYYGLEIPAAVLLKTGYAFFQDGSPLKLASLPTLTSDAILLNVSVAECPGHVYDDNGICEYCGHVCVHSQVDEQTYTCTECGMEFVVSMTYKNTVTYHRDLAATLSAAQKNSGAIGMNVMTTLTLLRDVTLTETVSAATPQCAGLTLDLNGHTLKAIGGLSLSAEKLGMLVLQDSSASGSGVASGLTVTTEKDAVAKVLSGSWIGSVNLSGNMFMRGGAWTGDATVEASGTLGVMGGIWTGRASLNGGQVRVEQDELEETAGTWNGDITHGGSKGGRVTVSDGVVNGEVFVLYGTVTVSGETTQVGDLVFARGTTVSLSGGTFGKIRSDRPDLGLRVNGLLADGFCFAQKDGEGNYQKLRYADLPPVSSSIAFEDARVVKCAPHAYNEESVCAYCNHTCAHAELNESSVCDECGKTVTMAVIVDGKETRYFDYEAVTAAVDALDPAVTQVTIRLLANTVPPISTGTEWYVTRALTIDLNGKTFGSMPNSIDHILVCGADLTLTDSVGGGSCWLSVYTKPDDDNKTGTFTVHSGKWMKVGIYGKLVMDGGYVDEILVDDAPMGIEISGGEVRILKVTSAPAVLSGGSFGWVRVHDTSKPSYLSLLAEGYAYWGEDGKRVPIADFPVPGAATPGERLPGLDNVTVAPCGAHDFAGAESCIYCGFVCHHEGYEETGVCTKCNTQLYVAKIGATYYATLEAALAAAGQTEGGATVTMLCDYCLSETWNVGGTAMVTLDLAGKRLTANATEESPYVLNVSMPASLTITGNGAVCSSLGYGVSTGRYAALYVENGTFGAEGGNGLALPIGVEAKLSGGTFYGITTSEGGSSALGRALAPQRAFFDENGEILNAFSAQRLGTVTVGEHPSHSFDGDGLCACGYPAVASVDGVYYADAKDAIDSAISASASGDTRSTVTILRDTELDSIQFSGADFILDLNGHLLEGDPLVTFAVGEGETLTLQDSSASGSGEMTYMRAEVLSGGMLRVTGGTWSNVTVNDGGTAQLTGGKVSWMGIEKGGAATVSGGQIGSIGVDSGTLTVTGDTAQVKELYFGASASVALSGGSYEEIHSYAGDSSSGLNVSVLLADGFCFAQKDGEGNDQRLLYADLPVVTYDEIFEDVRVVKCAPHSYNEESVCVYCNHTCAHAELDESSVCAECGKTVTMAVIVDGKETRYFDYEAVTAAVDALDPAVTQVTIRLLANTAPPISTGTEWYVTRALTIDLNGKTFGSMPNYRDCILVRGADLTLTDSVGGGSCWLSVCTYPDGDNKIGTLTVHSGRWMDVYAPGKLVMDGGYVDEILEDGAPMGIEISGGEVGTLRVTSAPAVLSGGSFGWVRIHDTSKPSYLSLLAEGYAYWGEDGKRIPIADFPAPGADAATQGGRLPGLDNVTVAPCGAHDFAGAESCIYCGFVCHHEGYEETGVCTKCNTQLYVAKIGATYYATLEAALAAAGQTEGGATVTMLCDYCLNETYSVAGTVTLDLAGKRLAANATEESPYVLSVPNRGVLTITGDGTICSSLGYGVGVTVSGAFVTVESGTFGAKGGVGLDMLFAQNATLLGGTFHGITATEVVGKNNAPLGAALGVKKAFFDEMGRLVDGYEKFKLEDTVTVGEHLAHDFGDTGKCPCGYLAVASLSDSEGNRVAFCATLEEALKEAPMSMYYGTITVLRDATLDTWITIDGGYFKLDWNGKTVGGTGALIMTGSSTGIFMGDGNIHFHFELNYSPKQMGTGTMLLGGTYWMGVDMAYWRDYHYNEEMHFAFLSPDSKSWVRDTAIVGGSNDVADFPAVRVVPEPTYFTTIPFELDRAQTMTYGDPLPDPMQEIEAYVEDGYTVTADWVVVGRQADGAVLATTAVTTDVPLGNMTITEALTAGTHEVRCRLTAVKKGLPDFVQYTDHLFLNVNKASSTLAEAPEAVTGLVYTGDMYDLVAPGQTETGKLVYSLSEYGEYTQELPRASAAGEYTVWYKVIGDANHNDSAPASLSVSIAKAPVDSWEIRLTNSLIYNGSVQTQNVKIVRKDSGLDVSDQFIVTDNTATGAGEHTLTVTAVAVGNYEGRKECLFVIQPKDIRGATITLGDSPLYSGSVQTQQVTQVVIDGLIVDTFTVTGNTGINADTYTLTVTGTGNFCGTADAEWVMKPKSITLALVTLGDALTYNGSLQTQTVARVELDGVDILDSCEITNNQNTKAGEYYLYLEGKGNYCGPVRVPYTIAKATLMAPALASKVYTGEVQTADVPESSLYTVVQNNGGIDVGKWYVFLDLTDPDNYQWDGSCPSPKPNEAMTSFEITKAENSWLTEPGIQGWTYGDDANAPTFEARFGAVSVTYGSEATGFSVIVPTKAGSYTARFTVAGTANYGELSADVPFTIAKREVTIVGAAVKPERVYDGTVDAEITNAGALSWQKTGDVVTIQPGAATYADKNVGVGKTVSFQGFALTGADADNYQLTAQPADTTADITARDLTLTVTVKEKRFDGTTDAEIVSAVLDGVVEGEDVTVEGGRASFDGAAPGEREVSFEDFTLAGADAGNYSLTNPQPEGVTGTILTSANYLDLTEEPDFTDKTEVSIDGERYPIEEDGTTRYVTLPGSCELLTTYTYAAGTSAGSHSNYPTSMQVYRIYTSDEASTVERIPELDDLLIYSGCSIRVTGKQGIRMITGISTEKKAALTGDGLAGYTLEEYGTVVCWASGLPAGEFLTLGKGCARSNFAYKKGVADPVFAQTGSAIQYTNVLVGFSLSECSQDLIMRPYITLRGEDGETVTLYGGSVLRSIGYIATQNRSVFPAGSAAHEYVWEIIHAVYGDAYDDEYQS